MLLLILEFQTFGAPVHQYVRAVQGELLNTVDAAARAKRHVELALATDRGAPHRDLASQQNELMHNRSLQSTEPTREIPSHSGNRFPNVPNTSDAYTT